MTGVAIVSYGSTISLSCESSCCFRELFARLFDILAMFRSGDLPGKCTVLVATAAALSVLDEDEVKSVLIWG